VPTALPVQPDGPYSSSPTKRLARALERAKAAAGDQDVTVMDGVNLAQQYVKAGLVDDIQIHLAPVLFGQGTRLFDHLGSEQRKLVLMQVLDAPGVTHLRFRLAK
jgi:dihydrofolate reductase